MQDIIQGGYWLTPSVFINKYLVPTTELTVSCVAGRKRIIIN
jgi:hypothetical protein